jgi:hypothetical protein
LVAVTRLDDLLGYDDSPRGRARRRLPARVTRTVIFCTVASVLSFGLLHSRGVAVPYILLLTVWLAAGAMVQLVRWLSPPPMPETLRDMQPAPAGGRVPDSDGLYRAVRRWAARLEWTDNDPQRFAMVVQPAVALVVDERLRLHHGIVRAREPDRARALCGPELWKFITVPASRPVSPNELATVVAQMEDL